MERELRAAGQETGLPEPTGRRERRPTGSALGEVDLLEVIRSTSVPASIGAGAWTHSWGWFAAAVAFHVVGGPLREFVDKVLGAAGDRLAERIRHGRRPPARARRRGGKAPADRV